MIKNNKIEGEKSIRYVSDFIGISPDAIRLYEREGLVHPRREEHNGYRYYSKEDAHKLLLINNYRNLDFRLSDIRVLLEEGNIPRVQEKLNEYICRNEEMIQLFQSRIEKMKSISSELKNIEENIGKYKKVTLPGRYVLNYDSASFDDSEAWKKVYRHPYISYGHIAHRLVSKEEDYTVEGVSLVIDEEVAKTYNIEIEEEFQYEEPMECVHTILALENGKERFWNIRKEVQAFADENHWKLGKNSCVHYIFGEAYHGVMMDYYGAYLPIVEEV